MTAGRRAVTLTNLTNLACVDTVVVMGAALNLYEAKTRLSALVDQAAAGAEIIIAKNGRPMAKLVAVRDPQRRKPGSGKGRIRIAKNFDAPLPQHVLAGFGGDLAE